MKLKVKATSETLEVAPGSYICGLNPNGNEVEFLAEDVEIIPNDWASFRREAAKAALSALISFANSGFEEESVNLDYWAGRAVEWADALIAKLKQTEI